MGILVQHHRRRLADANDRGHIYVTSVSFFAKQPNNLILTIYAVFV